MFLLPNAIPFICNNTSKLLNNSPHCLKKADVQGHRWEELVCTSSAIFEENYVCNDKNTQTEFIIGTEKYYNRIVELESEVKSLKLQLDQANKANTELKKLFTEGQIRKLLSPGSVLWKWEDISSAICLHAAGPRAYNHLYKKGFPLPHKSTLNRWCAKINLHEGILENSIQFMKQTSYLSSDDKICLLAFDEMKVAETFEYDPVQDHVRKPANYVQVVMARGIRSSWKQPVFYDFDCQMTPPILNKLICKLSDAGFTVVAIACDMGPSNRKLWRELGATADKPWFPSPACPEDKVFCFADVPHLLKLVRNHFLSSGLIVNNELLTCRTLHDLLKLTSASDVSIAYKLTEEHLSVKGPAKQKVKLAAHVFSNTTANAIRRCYSMGMIIYKPIETADFVQLVNDWFDIHNSKLSNFNYPGKQPYGLSLATQNEVLQKMTEIMSLPLIPGKKSLEPFQKGIIASNNALTMLHQYVKRYNMHYLVTNRLNQDVLEHFFGAIRSKGGLNDHPSPRVFKFRLRKYILARNTEHLNNTGNTEVNNTDWLGTSNSSYLLHSQSHINCAEDNTPQERSEEQELVDTYESNGDDIGILQEDALEYVSGYIIKKLNLEEYQCQESSFTWIDQVSKFALKKPSQSFLHEVKKLEIIFEKLNGKEISHSPNLKQRLLRNSNSIELPENIKELFFKCRIYFRIKHLNQRLKIKKSRQKLIGFSKMLKIKL